MPPILCDVSRLFYRRLNGRLPTGIDRVSLEYLRHYAARAGAVLGIGPFFSTLSAADSARAFRVLLSAPARETGELSALMLGAYLRWWTRPSVAGAIVLNTSHTGLERAGYAAALGRRGALPVCFVHDLIPITHPQYCRRGERERHVARMRTVLATARGVITPSRHTLDTLERYGGETGLSLPPAVVAPLASSLPRIEPGPRPIGEPYFVVVGTIEPRKNLLLLFRLWRGLVEREGAAAPKLVVIGQRGWACEEEVRQLESAALRAHVIERGACSDAELVTWLAHAQALLFPSFEEGYGLPLAEALALGVPAIAADLPAFREIAGDIPEYAAPADEVRWTALVRDYAAPRGGAREAQLARITRFRPTSWTEHFAIVDEFLERDVAGHGRRAGTRATNAGAPLLAVARALRLEDPASAPVAVFDPGDPLRARLAALLGAAADRRLADIRRAGLTREKALDALLGLLSIEAGAPAPQPRGDVGGPLAAAQLELKRRHFDAAERLFHHLLASGDLRGPVVAGIAEIARLRFDFSLAARLLAVYNLLEPEWQGGHGHFLQGRAELLAGNAAAGLEALAVACRLNPRQAETIASAFAIVQGLTHAFGRLPYAGAFFDLAAAGDRGDAVARAWALIAARRPAEAEQALLAAAPAPDATGAHALALSSARSAQGRLEEAKQLLARLLPDHPSAPLYAEALRIAVLGGDAAWGGELLAAAQARGLEVPEEYRRKVRLAAGDIRGGFDSFRHNAWAAIAKAYLGSTYAASLDSAAAGGKRVVVAFGGPGDEIRFAAFYPAIRRRCGAEQVVFTCEPRLAALFRRSFPGLEFRPVHRGLHGLARHDDLRAFRRLPGFDLHALLDDDGWALAKGADRVTLVSDAMADVVESHASFAGKPYLVPDPGQVARWRARLAQRTSGPLVGLSWRGSLANHVRNEHYYAVSELAPLFEETGIQYVNLQYDDCAEDLAWLEARYPGRLIDFADLDQHDDLDGVAALMSALDLVVTAPTTVSDLAGALGRPTWMLSNSTEHAWRIKPGGKADAWLGSVVHLGGAKPGSKDSVVAALATRLTRELRLAVPT